MGNTQNYWTRVYEESVQVEKEYGFMAAEMATALAIRRIARQDLLAGQGADNNAPAAVAKRSLDAIWTRRLFESASNAGYIA